MTEFYNFDNFELVFKWRDGLILDGDLEFILQGLKIQNIVVSIVT